MKLFFFSTIVAICFSTACVSAQSNTIGSGISLQFNGNTGNYVNLGDVFNSVGFPLTIEAWVNLEGYPPIYAGIFASDNDVSKYYGFWFFYTSTGQVKFEFGNSQGAGFQFRRGVMTTESLPLNKWIHVAVVCNSATDMHMYFNGVEKAVVPTDGASTSTLIVHSASSGSIGRLVTPFDEHNFDGQLDEVRLWNISRTQDNIRDFMCRKVSPTATGLIGYWTADESYTSTTVNDNTTPAENGTVVGTVTKLTSGAPLGDASKFLYTSSWSGNKITLGSPSNDKVTAKSITGTPAGVHVYRVDAAPFDDGGLNLTPAYYYGIFCAEGNSTAGYKVVYKYSTSNGVINSGNESTAELSARNDGSVTTWSGLNGSLDTSKNKISKNNQSSRREYILNLTPHGKLSASGQSAASSLSLSIFPNPSSEKITLSFSDGAFISTIRITDITGKVLQEMNVNGTDRTVSIDVSGFENGTYIVNASTTSGSRAGKFEVQK